MGQNNANLLRFTSWPNLLTSRHCGDVRCEAELMPQLWLQLEHKHLERRLLVAETSGALALNSSSRIHPLLLSICQQLIHDKLGYK